MGLVRVAEQGVRSLESRLGLLRGLRDRGWPVFPVRLEADEAGHVEKRPYVTGWHAAATLEDGIVAGWLERWPDMVPGIPTGQPLGLYVVDEDEPGAVAALGGALAEACETGWLSPSLTPGHRHLMFLGGGPLRSSGQNRHPGLDVKGEKGFVVAWHVLPVMNTMRPLPAEVLRSWGRAEKPAEPYPVGPESRRPRRAEVQMVRAVMTIAASKEGQRNLQLNQQAWRTSGFVIAGAIEESEWRRRLVGAAGSVGYGEDAAHIVLDSVMRSARARGGTT